jgi:hypothetical protein
VPCQDRMNPAWRAGAVRGLAAVRRNPHDADSRPAHMLAARSQVSIVSGAGRRAGEQLLEWLRARKRVGLPGCAFSGRGVRSRTGLCSREPFAVRGRCRPSGGTDWVLPQAGVPAVFVALKLDSEGGLGPYPDDPGASFIGDSRLMDLRRGLVRALLARRPSNRSAADCGSDLHQGTR